LGPNGFIGCAAADRRPHHLIDAEHTMIETTTCPDPECLAPAEVLDRFDLSSTDGPIEHIRTQCAMRHIYTVATDRTFAKVGDPYPFSTRLVGLGLRPEL
jgi:hypothetical protein